MDRGREGKGRELTFWVQVIAEKLWQGPLTQVVGSGSVALVAL